MNQPEQLKKYKSSCCDSGVYTNDPKDIAFTGNIIRCSNCGMKCNYYQVTNKII